MKLQLVLVSFVILTLSFTVSIADDQALANRMHQDWMEQDAPDPKNCFTNPSGNADEVRTMQKVIAELDNNADSWTKKMTDLQSANISGSDPRWRELYYDTCKERRKQRLNAVRESYPIIVYAKHDILGGSHYSYTESPSDAQFKDRLILPGGTINSVEITPDGETLDKVLVTAPKNGTLRDPDVSFDGKKIVFSMRNDIKEDDYHLYEYDVDTGRVRQLTFGLGFADIEPCYLPDGSILFASTRCMQIVDCWWTDVVNFYICDADGRFMRRIGFDQVHTNYPKVLSDGRITYTRWDYNDRGQIFPHGLAMMNHDGTGQTEYYGNNSWFPTSILHARGIPNSNKVVAIASGHHTLQKGKLIVIDRSKGTQENQGVQLIAPVRKTLPEHVDSYGQEGEQFQYPLAIDEENFIVAYQAPGHHFGLFYMDINNSKREVLAYDPSTAATHPGQPVPLQPRELPTLRASAVDYSKNSGNYYVQDVYFGSGLKGVERGTIKELRVIALQFRAAGIGQNGNGGAAGGALVSTPIAIDNGSWDVKQVLGTVPVMEDGSVFFEVPARTPIYFQLLNERGEAVQTMRSWSTLQPGEQQNCFGCHEEKAATTLSGGGIIRTQALRRAPRKPVPIEGVDPRSGFSFTKSIQPILDKHCVECHTGKTEEEPFSLADKPIVVSGKNVSSAREFSESYLNLTQRGKRNKIVYWGDVQSAPPMQLPYTAGAVKSTLVSMFDEGSRSKEHADVVIEESERRLLALWIDLLVPFSGSYTERHHWTPAQQAEYAYYQMKRDTMAEMEQRNIQRFMAWQKGEIELPSPDSFPKFERGGVERKKEFIETWLRENQK